MGKALLGLAACSIIYAMHLAASEKSETRRTAYVRSWVAASQRSKPNNFGGIALSIGVAAIATTIGLNTLWKETREDGEFEAADLELKSDSHLSDLELQEKEILFPQAKPHLSELEDSVFQLCIKFGEFIPASKLQQTRHRSLKGLSADDIRKVFQSLYDKGFGEISGEGKKLVFRANPTSLEIGFVAKSELTHDNQSARL